MLSIKHTIFIAGGILLSASMVAQTRVIHGRLTAFNTYPVQNIEIRSKKGKSATVSDSLGHFNIVCMEEDVIQIRPKTFQSVNRKIGPDTDSLIVNLVFINTRKNRDIAVGYGYIKESDLTYAISNLEQENNEYCHYHDVFELIQGRFAGVVVENGQVIIRGRNSINSSNEALYVVDGVIMNSIDWISPCEISSISIIKDSAAAAYGSRGSNGVVIIDLKKGLN